MSKKAKPLSPAQRNALLMMKLGGRLNYWFSADGKSFMAMPNGMIISVRAATAFTLARTPFVTEIDKDWRRSIYVISDAGRAALTPAPAALPVPDEPVQGSGSGSMAAVSGRK